MRYFKCIKEWRSKIQPHVNYGVLGEVYQLQEPVGVYRFEMWHKDAPPYIKLIGLAEHPADDRGPAWREWLNSERFEEIKRDT